MKERSGAVSMIRYFSTVLLYDINKPPHEIWFRVSVSPGVVTPGRYVFIFLCRARLFGCRMEVSDVERVRLVLACARILVYS